MKAIDGLLNLVARQNATELRLATNRSPRLFRGGDELPLTMPATSAEALQTLLGDLSAYEPAMRERGSAAFVHASTQAGDFDVRVNRRGTPEGVDLDVRFVCRRSRGPAVSEPPPRPSAAPVAAALDDPAAPTAVEPAELSPAIAAVLQQAAVAGASDVHLSDGRTPIIRVDGQLRTLRGTEPPDLSALLRDRVQVDRVRGGQSVDLGLDVAGVGRLRVNVYCAASGLCAAIRILTRDAPRLADLQLPPAVQSLVQLPHGLVIACGPTGSGKSTTLAALAQEALRQRPQVLISLEDPIEYRIQPGSDAGLVRQREVGRHVGSFAAGLRDALREDPDILLIGEMRDAETISLALTAAETGHLVFTSLHSRTSASSIERIVDTYPPERQRQIRVQLADALRAVISQRLLPRADGGGRVPAVEFLRVNHGVANLIREGKTPQILSALQSGRDEGMMPLERTLADLVRGDIVKLEAARAVASDVKTLDDYLGTRK